MQREGIDRNEDPNWENALRMANDFGCPVQVIYYEKVREAEQKKIEDMATDIKQAENEHREIPNRQAFKFFRKVQHFLQRHNSDYISGILSRIDMKTIEEKANLEIQADQRSRGKETFRDVESSKEYLSDRKEER